MCLLVQPLWGRKHCWELFAPANLSHSFCIKMSGMIEYLVVLHHHTDLKVAINLLAIDTKG